MSYAVIVNAPGIRFTYSPDIVCGPTDDLPENSFNLRHYSQERIYEIQDWIVESGMTEFIIEKSSVSNGETFAFSIFKFTNDFDAIHFKLRWVG